MTPSEALDGCAPATLLPAYADWLERLWATYASVTNCCWSRLRDRQLAERAGAEVVAGLLAKPQVFRHWGLPYGGRVAHLTEASIAAAQEGSRTSAAPAWQQIAAELLTLALEEQRVFVLSCVDGHDDSQLAAELRCDEAAASARRSRCVAAVRQAAGRTATQK